MGHDGLHTLLSGTREQYLEIQGNRAELKAAHSVQGLVPNVH